MKHILVVHDDRDLGQSLVDMLGELADQFIGLKKSRDSDLVDQLCMADMVFMDAHLDTIHTLELVTQLRRQGFEKAIIVVSAVPLCGLQIIQRALNDGLVNALVVATDIEKLRRLLT